jgi:broad specificity phosphatase PhoE
MCFPPLCPTRPWYRASMAHELWLIRHGETEWSLSGAHTGRTDIPLTAAGREAAAALRRVLERHNFSLILTSPLQRALETCRLAGFGEQAEVDPNLREWDYGDYEGLTTAQIRGRSPGIARVSAVEGDVALFAHGHILRVLAARWLQMPPDTGRHYALGTASLSALGYERETRVITRWNLSVLA